MIGRFFIAPFFGRKTPLAQRARKPPLKYAAASWAIFAIFIGTSCMPPPQKTKTRGNDVELSAIDIGNVLKGIPADFGAARNEWVGFAIRAGQIPPGRWELRVSDLRTADEAVIPAENYSLYQIAWLPIDTNSADYVRETGASVRTAAFPRVLVPANSKDGAVALADGGLTWIDIHIPLAAVPGDYHSSIDIVDPSGHRTAGSIPLNVTVYNFTLPDQQHLRIVGDVGWETLTSLYGERFVNLEPRLLSRDDQQATAAIAVLDSLMSMARENRLSVDVPAIAPTVKWPAGRAPLVEWDEYDSLVTPWAENNDYWPAPTPPGIERFDRNSQLAYEKMVTDHFAGKNWVGDFRFQVPVTQRLIISETDARLLAWNKVLSDEQFMRVDADPTTHAQGETVRVGDTPWFYPGGWFNTFGVVPTVQTKWLRQAEQDAEYLWLARDRGIKQAAAVSKILARPDSSATARDWQRARKLIAGMIARGRGQPITLDDDQTAWLEPLARARVSPRETRWTNEQGKLHLSVGVDVTRAVESWPEGGEISWSEPPPGWRIEPSATAIASLPANQPTRAALSADFDVASIRGVIREPADVHFVDAHSQKVSSGRVVIPVAVSSRRLAQVMLDANLNEWDASDAIWEGPLTRFTDRTTAARGEIAPAAEASAIYTAWGAENFYAAFKVPAAGATRKPARNFVEYQDNRAWGEDLCEVLIRAPGGEALHVVCKPGATLVERKTKDAWTAIGNAVTPYAGTIANDEWSGEVAIPWREILPSGAPIPSYLEFNFSHHRDATGESASWAGPVDSGRDEHFTGALILRDPNQ